jgi:hypothetical protein
VTNGLTSQRDPGGGLSAELVGEVNSVLSKLMTSLNACDPNLVPLITSLQSRNRFDGFLFWPKICKNCFSQ